MTAFTNAAVSSGANSILTPTSASCCWKMGAASSIVWNPFDQQRLRLLDIAGIGVEVVVDRPFGTDHGLVDQLALPAEDDVEDRRAVDRVHERLADPLVGDAIAVDGDLEDTD